MRSLVRSTLLCTKLRICIVMLRMSRLRYASVMGSIIQEGARTSSRRSRRRSRYPFTYLANHSSVRFHASSAATGL